MEKLYSLSNKGGAVLVVVGLVLIALGKGTPDAAIQTGGLIAAGIGAAIVAVKEVIQTVLGWIRSLK